MSMMVMQLGSETKQLDGTLDKSPNNIASICSSPLAKYTDTSLHDANDKQNRTAIERMEERMRERSDSMIHPMSSPLRMQRKSPQRSPGTKYTLRTRNYEPFSKRMRDERRAQIALEKRGGYSEMERVSSEHALVEEIERLNREANEHMLTIEELSEKSSEGEQEEDPYMLELEERLRLEQEELEYLTANLNLG